LRPGLPPEYARAEGFEILSDGTEQPFDEPDGAEELFDECLDSILEDEEIQRSIQLIPPEAFAEPRGVRDVVASRGPIILKETEAYRLARYQARQRYEIAAEHSRKPERAARITGGLAIASFAVAAIYTLILLAAGLLTDVAAAAVPIVLAAAGALGAYFWFFARAFRDYSRGRARFDDRERERDALDEGYKRVLRDEITAAIRRAINSQLRSLSTEFRIIDERGLRELADPEREVPTKGTKRLGNLMSSLAGGSIGLSGPRGCGKTTLLTSFATGRSLLPQADRRGLVVSAPVRYEARDFVLHLYARVCEQVLHPEGTKPATSRRQELRNARRQGFTRLLRVTFVVLAVLGGLMLITNHTEPSGPQEIGLTLLVLAALAFAGSLFLEPSQSTNFWEGYILAFQQMAATLLRILPPRVAQRYKDQLQAGGFLKPEGSKPQSKPEQIAEERLEEIRFQQTLASNWSADVSLPLGSKLSGQSTLTLARAPWTLPEAVDDFQSYIKALTQSHYIVIGIDELDKIASDEDAERFLNDIKAVFGVRGCYFLVSVSEEAMSSFERRGMPFRDVFDSAFDAILQIHPLSLSESRDLLESRVTGLPVPYQCLCHVLSGGLPRDLVRVARDLAHQHRELDTDAMGDLCRAVVASELVGKLAAAGVVLRSSLSGNRDFVLRWVQRFDLRKPDELSASSLGSRFEELITWSGLSTGGGEIVDPAIYTDNERLRALTLELMAFAYYAATVLDFFTNESQLTSFLGPSELTDDAALAIELLANARQQFAMSPALAATSVSRFRAETSAGLDRWELPAGLRVKEDGNRFGFSPGGGDGQEQESVPVSHRD
jgi:hypothetical protein